jgi:hypothetical protein
MSKDLKWMSWLAVTARSPAVGRLFSVNSTLIGCDLEGYLLLPPMIGAKSMITWCLICPICVDIFGLKADVIQNGMKTVHLEVTYY